MSAYEREAEAEALAMAYSAGASNEAMAMCMPAAADVQAESMAMATSPVVAGADPKANLPVLDLLHWSDTPNPYPGRSRMSATNDSSAFMNASDERPFLQPPIRSEVRTSQMQAAGIATPARASSNVLTEDSALSPKKPASLSEVAKQRELSGTFFGMGRDISGGRRPCSSAKSKELEGSNIFGRSAQDQLNTVPPKCLTNDVNKIAGARYQENNAPPRTSVKVSNPAGGRSQISFGCDGGQQFGMQSKKQGNNQKAVELSGHDIFKDDAIIANSNNNNLHNEKIVSAAKRREMLGNAIFSDADPVVSQDRPRRVRQPPGGDSNLKLI